MIRERLPLSGIAVGLDKIRIAHKSLGFQILGLPETLMDHPTEAATGHDQHHRVRYHCRALYHKQTSQENCLIPSWTKKVKFAKRSPMSHAGQLECE